jgi:phosphotransferase system enzyme I (PtsP)
MRTLDVGGDKPLPYFPVSEENPFLGWRGIRMTLDHPEIFLAQVRAMLRASASLDNLRILLPMVSCVEEVREARRLIEQARAELLQEGENIAAPGVGIMIEVPSAVYQVRTLARYADFLSVGSNDLTQYLLAVDRNNARVAALYDHLHPAVLCAVRDVVAGAHQEEKPVGVCGEMGADPMGALLLLGMGVDHLSMNVPSLAKVKRVIRSFRRAEAGELLEQVLAMETKRQIRAHLAAAFERAGLGGLVRGGR